MAITKQKKVEIVTKLKDILDKAKSVVFVNFKGLKVTDVSDIRRELRKEGIGYFVAKKTLTKIALSDKKIEGEVPEMEGELAIVYGEDDIAPARELYKHGEKNKGCLNILGGIFEGGFMSKEGMIEIAQIPDPLTLRAQFVNVINSPIQGLVISLNEIAKLKDN